LPARILDASVTGLLRLCIEDAHDVAEITFCEIDTLHASYSCHTLDQ
jgi:hypothetical protein